jgi:hypothetical protein
MKAPEQHRTGRRRHQGREAVVCTFSCVTDVLVSSFQFLKFGYEGRVNVTPSTQMKWVAKHVRIELNRILFSVDVKIINY